jgi:nucleotide-binding universal stress UspA family protein
VAYQHLLVVCDGTAEGDDAVIAASRLALHDHARLTVVAVAELERPTAGCGIWTTTWNDVLRDAAADDLNRARGVVESPAHFELLCGKPSRAVADAAHDLGCDAIMLARPRRRLGGLLRRDPLRRVRTRAGCVVLQPDLIGQGPKAV